MIGENRTAIRTAIFNWRFGFNPNPPFVRFFNPNPDLNFGIISSVNRSIILIPTVMASSTSSPATKETKQNRKKARNALAQKTIRLREAVYKHELDYIKNVIPLPNDDGIHFRVKGQACAELPVNPRRPGAAQRRFILTANAAIERLRAHGLNNDYTIALDEAAIAQTKKGEGPWTAELATNAQNVFVHAPSKVVVIAPEITHRGELLAHPLTQIIGNALYGKKPVGVVMCCLDYKIQQESMFIV